MDRRWLAIGADFAETEFGLIFFLSGFAALTLPYLDVGGPELLYTGGGGEPGRCFATSGSGVCLQQDLLLGLTL